MFAALVAVLCIACGMAGQVSVSPSRPPVDVALVLAVDISPSMDEDEFALQRAGYVEALRSPEFLAAVRDGAHGRIAIAYVEWAGTVRDDGVIGWQVIDGPESAATFADRIAGRPFRTFRGTSISSAIGFATGLIGRSGFAAERRVIDVSGDGPNNVGAPVTAMRDDAVKAGIVVNGLPIVIRPSSTFADLDDYYSQCVIGGPGAFMLPIRAREEFSTAIRRKLVMEVSGVRSSVVPVSDAVAIDCLRGERDRRLYSDPYFPELDR